MPGWKLQVRLLVCLCLVSVPRGLAKHVA
jgi:hypothetical protein